VTRRRTRRVGLVLLLVAGAASCGDDGGAPPAASDTTTTLPASLPPASALDLEPYFGASLAELGLRLTDRGGLIDRRGGGYEPSATGDHLALYVEPIGDRTQAQYISGIRDVAVVFADVFERWPGLASYDVCQEPVAPAGGQDVEDLPVTQIEITRQQAAVIDWDTVSVAELVGAAQAEPPGLAVRVSSALADDPAYEAILAEALGTP